jgi:hypothetical protein
MTHHSQALIYLLEQEAARHALDNPVQAAEARRFVEAVADEAERYPANPPRSSMNGQQAAAAPAAAPAANTPPPPDA